jgi:TonB family protein
MSCGIKKELEQANQSNLLLKKEVKELGAKKAVKEKELANCKESNSTLNKENRNLVNKINLLQGGNTISSEERSEVFTIVEVMPEFPGGNEKLSTVLSQRIQYPDFARDNNIQGKVYVQFVVNKDGSISDVKVMRGIGGGCDEEAVRAIKTLPKWKPGEQRGKPVRTRFILPVSFHLR